MLHRAYILAFACKLSACFILAASAGAQTHPPPTDLAFDVASVRASKPDAPQHTNIPLDAGNIYTTLAPDDARTAAGGLLLATHQPLWRYISFAYKLSGTQELALRFNFFSGLPRSGAPAWATGGFDTPAETFDIQARAPSNSTLDDIRRMMQTLLADRFGLIAHYATVEAPVLALVSIHAGIPGPNLRPHPATDTCAATPQIDQPSPPQPSASSFSNLPPRCGVIAHLPSQDPGIRYGARNIPLTLLATSLPTMTGLAAIPRPVIDATGLPGLYDFTLHWPFSPAATENGDNAATLHEALRDQLGLALKPTRAPVSILVLDHIEHPSDN